LVLTGPTGSGKTTLGVRLAERLDAEIISMDSMALYRGMDIGTAKPMAEERQHVTHHLIDVLEPWESASVAWWLKQAQRVAHEIRERGRRVLFVGGTALYLKALVSGLFDGPPADADLRRRLQEEALALGSEHLHRRLAEVDPLAASRLHPNDRRRIIRALEVHTLTGRPISAWQTQWEQSAAQTTETPAILWLDRPRTEMVERINRRVDAMFAQGLVEEVRKLRAHDRPLSREAAQAVGYKEVFAYLEGRASLEQTIEQVKLRSRQFAKRQLTWFRNLPGCVRATPELTEQLWGSKMGG
jgi:tRNA dimethylallyltransferase